MFWLLGQDLPVGHQRWPLPVEGPGFFVSKAASVLASLSNVPSIFPLS